MAIATSTYGKPKVIEFRQTLNVYTKQWCTPKRRVFNQKTGKMVWRTVKNLDTLITKRDGVAFALWRLRRKLASETLPKSNNNKWSVTNIVKIKRGVYSVFYFRVTEAKHSIQGVW